MLKIQAIMPVRNEADIVFWTIAKLVSQGIDVLVLDNHSTDSSAKDAALAGASVKVWGNTTSFSEAEKNALAVDEMRNSDADWVVYHDADEVMISPVPGESYRAFIERTAAAGFTAIDHDSRQYVPTDETFMRGDPEKFFKSWIWEEILYGKRALQERAHVRTPGLSTSTCLHTVDFPGKVLSPERGIRKHYPIRSTEHGMRKVFTERYGRSIDNYFTHYRHYLTDPRFIWAEADPRLSKDA